MVEKYLKNFFESKNFKFEYDTKNGFLFDYGGNGFEFDRLISLLSKNLSEWTYDLQMPLKIEIDCEYEKVKITL